MADNAMAKHRAKIKKMHEREAREKKAKAGIQAKKKVVAKKEKPVSMAKKPTVKKKSTLKSATARKNKATEELMGMLRK